MNSRAKRNIYLILTTICILCVVFIQSIFLAGPSSKKEFKLEINEEELLKDPYRLIVIVLYFSIIGIIFLTFLIIGSINLIIFCIKKLDKKPLTSIQEVQKRFPLSEATASKVLFLICFLMLLIYLLPIAAITLKCKFLTIDIIFLSNIVLQIGTAIIILKYIKANFFGFYWNKKQFVFLLRIYSSLVFLILVSSIINGFIMRILGLELDPGPAIEFFLHLKSEFSLFILVIQIVLLAPIAEELFFRGFIYKLCRGQYKFITSTILTSLLFALMHRIPQNILPLFLISACLCYVYEKTQNILPAIIFHSIHNSLTVFMLFGVKILV